MDDDEKIITAIDGMNDDGFQLLVLTQKRALILSQGVIAGKEFEEIDIDKITQVKSSKKFNNSCIELYCGSVKSEITKANGSIVQQVAQTIKDTIKASDNQTQNNEITSNNEDPLEEIRKYKELFDEGILTEEEFKAKKAQLLGI